MSADIKPFTDEEIEQIMQGIIEAFEPLRRLMEEVFECLTEEEWQYFISRAEAENQSHDG